MRLGPAQITRDWSDIVQHPAGIKNLHLDRRRQIQFKRALRRMQQQRYLRTGTVKGMDQRQRQPLYPAAGKIIEIDSNFQRSTGRRQGTSERPPVLHSPHASTAQGEMAGVLAMPKNRLLYVLPMKFAAGLCNRLATEAAATQVAAAMPAALLFHGEKAALVPPLLPCWLAVTTQAASNSQKIISRQKFSPAPAIGIIICLVRRSMAQSQYAQPIFPT